MPHWLENWERDFDLQFVYVDSDSADPYTEGITLGIAIPDQGSAAIENVSLPEAPGNYYIYAILDPPSSDPDCREATSTVVTVNLPEPFRIQGDSILCTGGSNSLSVPVTADYFWSTGATSQSIDVNREGVYSVTTTNSFGCETSATIEIIPNPITASSSFLPPLCTYDANGQISMDLLSGGVGTVLYQINNSMPQENPVFQNLAAGSYTVKVSDQSTCFYSETISLQSTDQLSVEIPPLNKAVRTDDSVRLEPVVSGAMIGQVAWSPAAGLSCVDCLDPVLKPKVPMTYVVTVTSGNGCVETDSVSVDVRVIRKIFAPNVFSPEAKEPNNKYFTISGGEELVEVEEMVIFNRWGQQIYQKQNFAPVDQSAAWDGTSGGQLVPPGVYVYYVSAVFSDGKKEVFAGDVTLIR